MASFASDNRNTGMLPAFPQPVGYQLVPKPQNWDVQSADEIRFLETLNGTLAAARRVLVRILFFLIFLIILFYLSSTFFFLFFLFF